MCCPRILVVTSSARNGCNYEVLEEWMQTGNLDLGVPIDRYRSIKEVLINIKTTDREL